MITNQKYFLLPVLLLGLIGLFFGCADGGDTPFATTTPLPEGASNIRKETGSSPVRLIDVSNGEDLFTGLGCNACHSTGQDTIIGPSLSGIKSKSDDYIRESITDPAAIIVEGFDDLMPKSFIDLEKADLDDLVGYLNTLD